ncbi:hypothetical protein Scep_000392 [Stephania cephalantha]|uniref:Uncharacterized protein n=1 Tax=Stephania cephalantha TaxID=152367 RepID=A0AAP0L6A6_9MAGN
MINRNTASLKRSNSDIGDNQLLLPLLLVPLLLVLLLVVFLPPKRGMQSELFKFDLLPALSARRGSSWSWKSISALSHTSLLLSNLFFSSAYIVPSFWPKVNEIKLCLILVSIL